MSVDKNILNNLSDEEKEILILKGVWESIDSMLNYEIVSLHHNDPESEINFNSITHKKFFNIILVDFLSSKIFGIDKTCMQALQIICQNPQYNSDIISLQSATNNFKTWLDQYIKLDCGGAVRNFWFPTINQEICLKITHAEFIDICGNISKHNPFILDRKARTITEIFARSNVMIETNQALLLIGEFYEQFHDDLFSYHSGTIAEFLNNLRWSIYEYLQPLHRQSVQYFWDERYNRNAHRFIFPDNIDNTYVRDLFLRLMNNVESEPYMPKFEVTRYLKLRY
jgi:hypothetical protein